MRTSFAGLEIALSGVYTSQRALNVINHNIANAGTEGYSRQVGEIVAGRPYTAYDGSGMVGTGSEFTSVNRVRDSYLDFRYWSESTTQGEWSVKNTAIDDLQALFNEPSDSSVTTVLNEFYSSMEELSKNPSSLAARASLKEKAVAFTHYLNNTSNRLQNLQRDYNFAVKSKVDEINSYAQQIRDLNEQIYKAELDGNVANDLRDKRGVLVDKLSKIVNIEASEKVVGTLGNGVLDKRYTITVSGHALVDHVNKYEMLYAQRNIAQRKNPEDADGLYDITWKEGNPVNVRSGELKAYLDARDGNGDVTTGAMNPFKGVPFYIQQLDRFARTFAQSLNSGVGTGRGFEQGYGLDNSTGIKLFTANSDASSAFSNYNLLTAANIGVSADILNNGERKIPVSDAFGQSGNANILNEVLEQRHDTTMFSEGSPEDYVKSLIATMGVDGKQAKIMNDSQDNIIKHLVNKRESASGVSLDEEMSNVVKFQHIYTASAKLISVMDELYNITVNSLGMR